MYFCVSKCCSANARPLKIVIHKHYLALVSVLGETTQTYPAFLFTSARRSLLHSTCTRPPAPSSPAPPLYPCLPGFVCKELWASNSSRQLQARAVSSCASCPSVEFLPWEEKKWNRVQRRTEVGGRGDVGVSGAGSFITHTHTHTPFPLWVPGLWPIRPISNNKTQENTTKPGRQAGGQVVNGGRNCYLSHRQEQRKHSQECTQKGFIPPSVLNSTIKLFTAISRRFRVSGGT